jgi:hypothetical protein
MTTRRLLVPLLVALLVAALIGPGMTAGAEPRATVTRTMMISPSAFSPADGNGDYANNGMVLWAVTGTPRFVAPVSFAPPEVTVKKIVLYALDDLMASDICVQMMRSAPAAGEAKEVGTLCSTGADDVVRTFTLTALNNRKVVGVNGVSLFLSMPGGSSYTFWGVKITYTYETGA